jgi:acyl-CoA synthetase (AMP-forming)/AMP-acid ligase II/acyl carrier protein
VTAALVPDLLRERVTEAADAVALRVGAGAQLTYGEWEQRSNSLARGLVARGVRPGDRVGLVFDAHRWLDYAAAYLGVLKAAGTAVPVGSRFSGAELNQVLAHAGVAGVVRAGGPLPSGDGGGWWESEPEELAAGRPTDAIQEQAGVDDVAEILYTSGTTGAPKGVACTHLGLLAHDVPADAGGAGGAGGGRVSFLHAFPIGTQAGQESLRVPLRIGRRVAIALPSFDADDLCALVARHGVVRLQLVPSMAQVLAASGAWRRYDVSSLRRIVLSGAPAAPALFQRLAAAFPGVSLWNAYALTEAGPARTLAEWDPDQPDSVGWPVGGTELRVANDAGREVPLGEAGEVWLRRPGTPPRWYFNDPEATARTFLPDGWVRSGDRGRLDAEGRLHLTGRMKDLIITGGSNVSAVEVEHALAEHPAVVDAAVFGLPHPVLGEDVAAAVVVRAPTSPRELQDVVRARLAEHKVPHRVFVVDDLPRNPSGKVLKAELRARFGATPAEGPFVAARTDTEAVVASVWEAVLELPRVGVEDDFFALGGHSLAAGQITARLQDAFGVELPVGAVFEAPTVAELAVVVEAATAGR